MIFKIFTVSWVVLSLALWMACECWRREDYCEWWDWIEDEDRYEPWPLLDATWRLWLKVRPLYDWGSYQLYRPYLWALRRGWVKYSEDESCSEWQGSAMSPVEELLAIIEWEMNPGYQEIMKTWEEYLRSRDAEGETSAGSWRQEF